jgi:hypothetical protein
MSVQITNRVSTNARAASGSSNFLNGNVGDWQETILTVRVAVETKTTLSNQITVNTDDTWTLSSGTWESLGFAVGDAITGTLNYTNSGTNTDLPISVNVTAISGNVMTVDAAIFATIPASFIVPSTNGGYTLNWMEVRAAKGMNAAKVEYNQILNSQVGSPSLTSILDGSATVFSANSIGSLNEITPQSGNAVYSVNVVLDSYTSGVSIFSVTVVHAVAGFYDTTNDIDTNTQPSWFNSSECFGDAFRLTFYPTAGSPLGAQVSEIKSYSGNTGWFNENRNGAADNFTVTSVVYKDSSSNVVTSLLSDEETTIEIRITSGSAFFDSTNSKFNFGIASYLPIDRSSLDSNSENALGVICSNTMGVNQVYTHSVTPTVATIAGFPNDSGAQIDIESYLFTVVNSTTLDVTMVVSPNSTLTTLLNSQAVGDRLFAMWVALTEHSTAYTPAVRVNKLISGQFLPAAVVEETLDDVVLSGLYVREKDYYTASGSPTTRGIIEEDDLHAAIQFRINEDSRITSAELGSELVNSTTGEIIVLETNTYDLSTQPVDASGIQQINFTTNRPFNYVDGFKDKVVTLQRLASIDSGSDVGFEFIYPTRFRYEWWLQNNNYTSFYDNSEPLDNINNEWETKQNAIFSDWSYRYFQKLTIDGTVYKNTIGREVYPYRDAYRVAAGYSGSVALYSDDLYADSLLIGTKTNKLLCNVFAFDESNPNYLKSKIIREGTTFTNTYTEVTLEGEDGSGYLSQWKLRSDQTPEANNPIRPLSGETTLKVTSSLGEVVSECYIDASLIPSGIVNLKLTASFAGTASGGSGESIYHNRDMIFGIIGRANEQEPDTYCTIDETCDYKLPVFADTESTDYYKNDIKGIFRKRTVLESDINFFLVEEDGTEHALNDNSYGTIYDFGVFTYEPNLKAYQLRWRDVLADLGAGCYIIKTVVTDIRSNDATFYSCCYDLQHYDCQTAHRTVRIESVQNGYFEELDLNFKGINWLDHLRFDGYFGYEIPKHESTINIKTNNSKELNRMDLKSTFKLTSSLVPSICVTHPLWTFHLMASEIYISDYNLDNHRRDYISFPVFFEEVDDVSYFKMNTNATMSLSFSERVIARRVSTCLGDRPNSYLASGFVWGNQCPVDPRSTTIRGLFPAGVDGSDALSIITIVSGMEGTYTSITDDGGSGALSVKVNGVSLLSPFVPFDLEIGDTLQVIRATSTSDGYYEIIGTYI